jgi:ABC-type branched-subunit amino acid transport system ATPase component
VLLEKGLVVAAGASSELGNDDATLARYLGV